jgi:hypothetical protein
LHALLKKAVLQEKEKAAAADLKVKQLSLELHRKNEEQVRRLPEAAKKPDGWDRMCLFLTILVFCDAWKLFRKSFSR